VTFLITFNSNFNNSTTFFVIFWNSSADRCPVRRRPVPVRGPPVGNHWVRAKGHESGSW